MRCPGAGDSKDKAIGEFVPEYEHDPEHEDAIEFTPTELLPRVAGDGVLYTQAELEQARQLHESTKDRLSARQRKRLESAGLEYVFLFYFFSLFIHVFFFFFFSRAPIPNLLS